MVSWRVALGIKLALNLNSNSVDLMDDSEAQFSHLLYWNVNIIELRGLLDDYIR